MTESPHLLTFQSADVGGQPIFAVPPISGSPYVYKPLARSLGPDHLFYAFEAPGFDDDLEPITSLPQLAETFLAEMPPPEQHQTSVVVLGWSMGGATAAHMVHRLAAKGRSPVLVVIDAEVPRRRPMPPHSQTLARFLLEVKWLVTGSPPTRIQPLSPMSDEQPGSLPWTEMLDQLESRDELPPGLDADSVRHLYRVFRANLTCLYSYELSERVAAPVLSIVGTETSAETRRWNEVADHCEELQVPGNHYSMWEGDGVAAMALLVRTFLDRVAVAGVHGGTG